ncbi:MAG: Exonuclease RNase and polymerase [Bacteroidetes bacterium]|nr:Exonuclease RNase and polymerase [Bacteroidota bacterium]
MKLFSKNFSVVKILWKSFFYTLHAHKQTLMNFVAIDFETAHADFPCEIGLTRVTDGVIGESKSWLIKPACFPYMNPWNERVHGISSADLADAPGFDEIWPELKLWIDDSYMVAHNAAFDMKVLRSALQYYDLAVPWVEYFCSVSLSRRAWKNLPSHSLGTLCEFHNIRFRHHRAGDDARACAIITLRAFEELGIRHLSDVEQKVLKIKRLDK